MTLAQTYYHTRSGHFPGDSRPYYSWKNDASTSWKNDASTSTSATSIYNTLCNINCSHMRNQNNQQDCSRYYRDYSYNLNSYARSEDAPSLKKRKFSGSAWENCSSTYQQLYRLCQYENIPSNKCPNMHAFYPSNTSTVYNNNSRVTYGSSLAGPPTVQPDAHVHSTISSKRDHSTFEEEDVLIFMSRDEIERCSPSRKDGIDVLHETHLRYSYCAFLQNLGIQLGLPQTTIGTAMVLCHRFFVRKSHACHDRFLVATAALFLSAKSEYTPRPLNNLLRVSCEILHNKDFTFLSYMFPVGWFEQYRERIIEAEQMILTTLNFELNVQHPYASLTSTLDKLGFSRTVLVNLALNLVSEGLRSSLWLQFKPHQIAAGAAYLAAKYLNMNLSSCHSVWKEFHTPPSVLKDIAQQLMELF